MDAAVSRILMPVLAHTGLDSSIKSGVIGWEAYDTFEDVMPTTTWDQCHAADAILLGAVGLPLRDHELEPNMRPERRALLPLRQKLGLGVNIRPITVIPSLAHLSPLKERVIGGGVNITMFRELLGDVYFGKQDRDPGGQWASDTGTYMLEQITSIAYVVFETARLTGQKVTSIDKANVLCATGSYWREVVTHIHATEYPDVILEHQFVDSANLDLFVNPGKFQIVMMPNLFGDILSDGAAGIAGSMGLLPSASLNPQTGKALYEPAGGSAPDIAGHGVANPVAMILSIALMFRHTFKDEDVAVAIESAVKSVLEKHGTPDICKEKSQIVSTTELAHMIGNKTLQMLEG